VRGRFYWEGCNQEFKHHSKWEYVCKPKDYGGLGLINTRYLNIALLLKWIWNVRSNDHVLFTCSCALWRFFSGQLSSELWVAGKSQTFALDLFSLTRHGSADNFDYIRISSAAVMWSL
jgi:hypothetical protein